MAASLQRGTVVRLAKDPFLYSQTWFQQQLQSFPKLVLLDHDIAHVSLGKGEPPDVPNANFWAYSFQAELDAWV